MRFLPQEHLRVKALEQHEHEAGIAVAFSGSWVYITCRAGAQSASSVRSESFDSDQRGLDC